MRHTFNECYRLDDDLLRKVINPKYLSKDDQKSIGRKVENSITRLLKGHQFLADEISEKLKIPQKELMPYLDRMEYAKKLKTSITEDVPFEKVYRV
jgi:signal transduction histidine kinase